MASGGAGEQDVSAVRTPLFTARPSLFVRAKSAVFHTAAGRRVVSGSVEEKKKREGGRRPQSADPGSAPPPWHAPRPGAEAPCVEARPRPGAASASCAIGDPPPSRRLCCSSAPLARTRPLNICVRPLASGKTPPPPRACLPVPPDGAAAPPPASVPSITGSPRCSCSDSDDQGQVGLNLPRHDGSTRAELTSPKSLSTAQPAGAGLLGKRSLPPQRGAISTVSSYPTRPSPPKSPAPTPAPADAMPTNHLLRVGPAATPIITATKVPSARCPAKPASSDDFTKPSSSDADTCHLKQEATEENATTSQSHFTAVPRSVSKEEVTGAPPQHLGRSPVLTWVAVATPRPVQNGTSGATEAEEEVRTWDGVEDLVSESLGSFCRRDLDGVRRDETTVCRGEGGATDQLSDWLRPSFLDPPPLCLTSSGQQEAAAGQKDTAASQNTTGSVQTAAAGLPPNTPTVPTHAGGSQDRPPTETHGATDVTGRAAGPSVGSVTNQISAFHLTQQEKPSSSSPSSSSSSSSPSKERLLSSLECVAMQVDGDEEEFPNELENACSDDDESDGSTVTGTSSTASISLLYGIEEPMSGVDEDREEKPALVPSLFPFFPPTLYFSTANERVELLPPEQRRLLKWKMSTVTPNVVKHTIARSHFKVTKRSHDWLGCWGHHMKSPGFKAIREYQKLNHFPGSFQIGRKDRLWRNLSKMQARFGKREFGFFPRSFILPQDIKLLRKAWEDGGSHQKWIIKPPASARGIGIQVIHKWSQMPRKRPLLVQKYLHKPYLISGNKFDLRIYVYVTSYDPLRVYIFSDGLVRFASCKYSSSMKSLSNKFMHLTNYSVNKKNSEYQSNSDDKACQGHKWALKALWQYLGSKGINTTLIWEKIKDIVIKTIVASDPYVNSLLKVNVRSAYSCHELFGFDIMLDDKLKPWLLEVNISPSLHSNTALDVSIKGQMIRDLLNLAGFLLPHRDDVLPSCSSSSLCAGSRDRSRGELSTDEKVKRAFYLTQRSADQDFLASVLDVLTPDDVRVLAESEDELSRRGEFERVFPSPASSRYLRFFECPRYLNLLLDQWEQSTWNNRVKGISLLRTLCQRGVHLGTSDPAHMWSKCSYLSRFGAHRQDLVSPSSSSVVVSLQRRSLPDDDEDDSSDRELRPSSIPPPSPGAESSSSSSCPSPEPQTRSLTLGCPAPL
ncbi:tubulin monoglutamylase TTLL4 isoform X2 [Myripristis murdjan]|uniref:tubulin monoglutamylase TTLL4 isoform X2 n=1 Tax=Myripristis murdjan TaxID=586833 RepID=UPI0011762088|nr:tubulin polyglutamylase TTLL4 isoform X2 [Myripristis murdjan]